MGGPPPTIAPCWILSPLKGLFVVSFVECYGYPTLNNLIPENKVFGKINHRVLYLTTGKLVPTFPVQHATIKRADLSGWAAWRGCNSIAVAFTHTITTKLTYEV